MKIVLTVHEFLPEFVAGTEILTFETAKGLQKRGHDVIIWTGHPSDEPSVIDEYVYEGIPVKRYKFNRTEAAQNSNLMEADYRNPQFGNKFREFLLEYKPDLIHFFHVFRLSADVVFAGRDLNIPMVFTTTDFWMICPTIQLLLPDNSLCIGPEKGNINCLRHIVTKTQSKKIDNIVRLMPDCLLAFLAWGTGKTWWPKNKYFSSIASLTRRTDCLCQALNLVDRVLVPTKIMNDLLVKHGVNADKVTLQPFGVKFAPLDKLIPRQSGEELRIGYIGNINEHKGLHILLEAIDLLGKDAQVNLKIYGNAGDFPEFFAKIKKMAGNDPRIQFCGTFPNEEINLVFSQMDVLVVPSIWYENTPLVIHSAQANKTPVIVSDVGGMTEVIEHDKNGLAFPKGNAQELSRQIKRLLNDKGLLAKLSKQAKEPKTMDTYVEELEEIYRRILSERGKDK